jgi:hypothetical protein
MLPHGQLFCLNGKLAASNFFLLPLSNQVDEDGIARKMQLKRCHPRTVNFF